MAAGCVVLAVLLWLLEQRFGLTWRSAAHLAYAAPVTALVLALAVLSPLEGAAPRPFQTVLYATSLACALALLDHVADAAGSDGFGHAGSAFWVFGLVAALAFWFATARRSAVCTLLGCIAGGVSLLAFVEWVFEPEGPRAYRWLLLGLVLVFVLCAVAQRDRRKRHAVALADAAGVATLFLGLSFLLDVVVLSGVPGFAESTGAGWGWELVLFAVGFGAVAYAAVDREPGVAYLGVANLVVAVVVVGEGDSLLGWPLVLAAGAGALLVAGLRPTTPAPPPPDEGAPAAPTAPLRPAPLRPEDLP